MKRLIKVFLIVFSVLLVPIMAVLVTIKVSGDSNFRGILKKTIINDVTAINPIQSKKVITPKFTDEIVTAIKDTTGPISIGGGRYSMGGQTAIDGGLQIDMRHFNQILQFSKEKKEITVQAGIRWRDIQEFIDKHNLSLKIMQTYSNFTVGGSLSVNVHGRYMGQGPVILSVKSIKVVLANGELIEADPVKNQEIFYSAIGGYGGIGVITEVTLSLDENVKIQRKTKRMNTAEYKKYFFENIRGRSDIVFHNADIYPTDYDELLEVSWYKTNDDVTINERLISRDRDYFWLPKITKVISTIPFGYSIRKNLLEPLYYSEDRIVWRNWEASYDVRELEPGDRSEFTYVLQEYFIPVERFDEFYPKMKKVFNDNKVNVLNVSIRHAYKDPGAILAWARSEVFAFVVYHKQGTTEKAKEEVKLWTRAMIDQILSVGGSYYLPYQIHATLEQFHQAYPQAAKFFTLKKKYDPQDRFQNKLLNAYSPCLNCTIKRDLNEIPGYKKGEEQTYLTLPEWYLVFNPQEYVDYLYSNRNPSDFPFIQSIDEYWKMYDRVTYLVKDHYPENSEYITMLKVIGVSTTIEYLLKGGYEKTIGQVTRWMANGNDTAEDDLIKKAQQSYVQFIYDEPWYNFSFTPWVKKIWSETPFFGKNFIRKLERKSFFTLEFLTKGIYSVLIKMGAESSYAPPMKELYVWVKAANEKSLMVDNRITIFKKYPENNFILKIPRWKGFSEIIPKLAQENVEFVEIAGNDDIALSVVTNKKAPSFDKEDILFESSVFSEQDKVRLVLNSNVGDLTALIRRISNNNAFLEHIYDY